MGVKESFDKVATQYDQDRRRLIPCFDDFYGLPMQFLRMEGNAPEVLDIGAGTGLFSGFVRRKYPGAKLTLIDFSEKMLRVAKERFGDADVTYIVDDYCTHQFEQTFDCIISALSIHHLPAAGKQALYKKCYTWLKPGGVFINADQVSGASREMDRMYAVLRDENLVREGFTEEEMQIAYERMKEDDTSQVDEQLEWLREAGFRTVDCIYKYTEFATFYAQK